MGQAMDHQDNHIPLWDTPNIIQQIIFKIFPRNNILGIGRQMQTLTTSRKCKDLQIPQNDFTVAAKPQQWWDRFTSVKIQTSISDTNWSTRNQTNPEIWIPAENKVKHFQPEQGRSSSSDSSRNTLFYRVPNPRASAEGCGHRLNQRPSPSPQLYCLGSVPQIIFLKLSKILPWWIEVSLEQTFYKENYTFLRVSISHWKPGVFFNNK